MNTELFLFYVAIGAITELLTMNHPTPGQQWAAGFQITAVGAVLGYVLPPSVNTAVFICVGISGVGRICGRFLGKGIDRLRVGRELRRMGIREDGRNTESRWPQGR